MRFTQHLYGKGKLCDANNGCNSSDDVNAVGNALETGNTIWDTLKDLSGKTCNWSCKLTVAMHAQVWLFALYTS